jgi:hypothetical protein
MRISGFSDSEILEVIANVACCMLMNLVNIVADTEIDFDPSRTITPPVRPAHEGVSRRGRGHGWRSMTRRIVR